MSQDLGSGIWGQDAIGRGGAEWRVEDWTHFLPAVVNVLVP